MVQTVTCETVHCNNIIEETLHLIACSGESDLEIDLDPDKHIVKDGADSDRWAKTNSCQEMWESFQTIWGRKKSYKIFAWMPEE